MSVNGVKLTGKVCIIRPAASHGTDPVQIVVILDNSHISVHAALYRGLIHDIRTIDAVLRQRRLVVAHHNRYGPAVSNRRIHHPAGQITPDLSILLGALFISIPVAGFHFLPVRCLRCRLYLNLFRRGGRGVRLYRGVRHSHLLIFSLASGHGAHQKDEPGRTEPCPFFHRSYPPRFRISSCFFSMTRRSSSTIWS